MELGGAWGNGGRRNGEVAGSLDGVEAEWSEVPSYKELMGQKEVEKAASGGGLGVWDGSKDCSFEVCK